MPQCPCECGRQVPPSLNHFISVAREIATADAVLERFSSLVPQQQDETVRFQVATADLRQRLIDRCHGSGGLIDGIRLGRDAARWRNAFAAVMVAIERLEPPLDAGPMNVVHGAAQPDAKTPWRLDEPLSVEDFVDPESFTQWVGIANRVLQRVAVRVQGLSSDDVYQWLRDALDRWNDNDGLVQPHVLLAAYALGSTGEGVSEILDQDTGRRAKTSIDVVRGYLLGRALLGTHHAVQPIEGVAADLSAQLIEHARFFSRQSVSAWPEVTEVIAAVAGHRSLSFPEPNRRRAFELLEGQAIDGIRLALSEALMSSDVSALKGRDDDSPDLTQG